MIEVGILIVLLLILWLLYDIHSTFYHKPRVVNIYSQDVQMCKPLPDTYNAYTFYSEKYKGVYDKMMTTFDDPKINLTPIVVPQEDMESCFNRTHKMFYDYRWRGCDIKIHLLIERIKSNMAEDGCDADANYILFLDSDLIFVKPIGWILDYYKGNQYDIVCTEACVAKLGDEYCLTTGANIGVLFVRCTPDVLGFFERVQDAINKNEWDEGVTKKELEKTYLKHALFPAHLVSTQHSFNPQSCLIKIIGSYIGLNKNQVQDDILKQIQASH